MAAAALWQAFLQPDQEAARQTWRHVAEQMRTRFPKLAELMDGSEHDVLALKSFPAQPRGKLHRRRAARLEPAPHPRETVPPDPATLAFEV